ncbi:GerAB/ArcD/ProY family transporter [Paenibacillus sp. MWE-103]|uniref:GerAB/ArcD/ProY family transporter n=1 Tax=Paenibacillus artemisiicola TaxID=1172618 RepID=A0ABS3WEW5_9BACL|nr:GerAB/ArcD/ProY family transporter [Paenibacillus artemisiicola]MBO7746650.1 GerAB/ArcD/ProY family transporter [Paenibacillus artemisiicola]
MKAVKEKLSSFHTMVLIYMTQTGVAVLALGQMLAVTFGYNSWLALPAYAAVVTVNLLLIGLVHRMGRGKSIFDIMERRLPKPLLAPLYLLLISVWSMLACLVIMEYVLVFQMIAFPTTNSIWFKLVIDMLGFMLFTKGLYTIAKASTVFFYLTVWMYPLSCMFFNEFNWTRLTPFLLQGGNHQPAGIVGIYYAFLGYELVLLLFGHVDRSVKLIKMAIWANLLVLLSYAYICFLVLGFFGLHELQKMQYPLIDMFAFIKFPFIERIENVLYGLLLFTMLSTMSMYFWASNETSGRLLPKIKSEYRGGALVAGTFLISMMPDTIGDVDQWLSLFARIEIGISFGLPLFLIALLLIRKEKETTADA